MTSVGVRRGVAMLVSIFANAVSSGTVGPACAQKQRDARSPDDVGGLPLHISAPKVSAPSAVAILLSGDGGWADIDKRLSARLVDRGMGVVGVDSRSYFMTRRTPDESARDVARLIRHFTEQWSTSRVVLIGYARGASVAPFVANRLPTNLRGELMLVALLGPAERASFHFRWLDLLSDTSDPTDLPILPELERLRGTRVLCVFGREEKESVCRLADPSAVRVDARNGRHHFDGNYDAIAAEIARLAGAAANDTSIRLR